MNNYDFRLSLRGDQSPNNEIVIVELTPHDINSFVSPPNELRELKEESPTSLDSRYWSPQLWRPLLSKLLILNPKAIVINIIFDDKMSPNLSTQDWRLFEDDRLIWMGALSQSGRIQLPSFADPKNKNFGFRLPER